MVYAKILKPSKQRMFKKKVAGFDIETYGNTNEFLNCSFVADDFKLVFYDRLHAIESIRKLKHMIIASTNLSFDFNGLFGGYAMNFETLYRGSDLLCATSYIYHGELLHPKERYRRIKEAKNNKIKKELMNNSKMIKFVDTMSYTPMSVEKLGIIVKINKMDKPKSFTKLPDNFEDIKYNTEYNIQDALISKSFIEFLYKGLSELGASVKLTIGSCAMSLFRNKYLKENYFRADKELILKMFNSYYGGRTECYVRGRLSDYAEMPYKLYDINCFSSDTEILTNTGFVKYNELKRHHIVYSMNNEKLVKNHINKIIIKKYKGKMIRIQNENTDQLVTPNHRIYYKDYGRTDWHIKNNLYGWSKDWKVKEAKDISKTYINLPNAKKYSGKIRPDVNRLKLSAWYITEGHLTKYNTVEISQSWNHNRKNCIEILSILNKLKINYKRRDRVQKNKKYLYVYFKFSEISSIMKHKYFSSYEMRLPYNFMEYDIKLKEILFNELLKGDGSIQKGKTTYVSYSDKLLSDFQILSTMLGFKCSVKRKNHVCYVKLKRTGNSMLKSKKEIDYDGVVWCVNVKYKNVVVRRNGKVFISGNSLYPHVMKNNKYPNPNTLRHCYKNDVSYIDNFEGMSHVDIYCPYMKYPLLPMRTKDKLLFPVGEWSGWYTHVELREAKKLGYTIKKVHETIYFNETCEPFKEYVDDLYKKRLEYKEQKSEMETITKLLLNSLYGKFGQKFIDKENVVSSLIFNPKETKFKNFEIYNDYFVRVVEDREPAVFCMPMWASYVTAYARLEIYKYIKQYNPLYVDTDSIITRNEIETGTALGQMKCEMTIKDGILIKPKFYAIINKNPRKLFCPKCRILMQQLNDNNEYICREHNIILSDNKVKIKGVGTKLDYEIFKKIVYGETHDVKYNKFVKFKESLRRNIKVNSIIPMIKELDLFDTKRIFTHNNFSLLSDSEPIDVKDKKIKSVLYTEQIKYFCPAINN